MTTIPASTFVNVTPSVISAGGAELDLIGLILTTSTRVPLSGTNTPTVQAFGSAASVASFFGASSKEAQIAGGGSGLGSGYFGGFDNSLVKPGSVLFAQYNTSAAAAYLRGASVAALTLAQLQALSGSLSVTMDGYARVASSIVLSGAASFSAAAALIQTGLNGNPIILATGTATITGGTMTVTGISGNNIAIGQTVIGTGVAASTVVLSQITGTAGGTGTYGVSVNQTMSSSPITLEPTPVVVTYDSVSGAFIITSGITGAPSTSAFATGTLAGGTGASAALQLTSLTGAVLSQGAAAATPAAFMNAIVQITQNWATFMLGFDPDGGVTPATQKLAFAAWANGQNNRYVFVCWDTDINPTTTVPATNSMGYLVGPNGSNYSGTVLVYEPSDQNLAAFVCGAIASIDFEQPNGRQTLQGRSQSGLVAGVTAQLAYQNLVANGYNCYAAVGTAAQNFIFFAPGSISGPFSWIDSFVDQIWLNNQFQLALLNLLVSVGSIPYNPSGNSLIEASLTGPINAGVNFGAIRAGVTLSAAQTANVNNQAGANVAPTLQQRGWYLQTLPASPQVRAARQSPPVAFWYCDGQSVQAIQLSSIELQ
jgi:hypothetical protein